jgi:hypothetical protein
MEVGYAPDRWAQPEPDAAAGRITQVMAAAVTAIFA